MIYAAILAAGFGARMNRQDLPKPYLPLGTKPILIHTLEQFCVNQNVDKVIVIAAETWRTYAEDSIQKYGLLTSDVVVISGGKSKTESIELVTKYIVLNYGTEDDDILIAHDAIRPFVTQRVIDDNIRVAQSFGAANTVMTTNDMIIVTQDGITMSEVPLKYQMFAEQTPQTYKLVLLSELFDYAARERVNLSEETAFTRLFLRFGKKMRLVSGEYSNMKIINPYDLEVANALLVERSK